MSTQTQEENPRLSSSLLENLIYFRSQFDGSFDFVVREFQITGTPAALFSLEGMVNKHVVAESVLNPILSAPLVELDPWQKFRYIRDNSFSTVDQVQLVAKEEVFDRLANGFAVLATVERCVGVWRTGVPVPQRIRTQRGGNPSGGSREGFVEPLQINMSLIRPPHENPQAEI